MAKTQDKTVVSITPLAVERDSRTYKQAASLAQLGYRSIVVEGEGSVLPRDRLPFDLISVYEPDLYGARSGGGAARGPSEPPQERNGLPRPVRTELRPVTPADEDGARPNLLQRIWRPLRRHVVRRWWEARMWLSHDLNLWIRKRVAPISWPFDWNVDTYRALPAADLYLVHAYVLSPAVMIRARKSRAPYIYDAHDAYFEIKPEQRARRPGQRIWEWIERRCVRGARELVTVSEGVADMLEERHGRRPVVIRNCHDIRLDQPAEPDLRARLGLAGDQFLLASLGNYKEGMNVENALQALARLPEDVHLAFVGRGHEPSGRRIEELGLRERAHLVGHVPPTEVARFAASANATVVLYHALTRNYLSALPNGFFQGIAAGMPILFPAELPELAAIAERHDLGIPIDPRDPESIAEAVLRLRDEPELRTRLERNAAQARETENWEREEQRLARLVESVAGPASEQVRVAARLD